MMRDSELEGSYCMVFYFFSCYLHRLVLEPNPLSQATVAICKHCVKQYYFVRERSENFWL